MSEERRKNARAGFTLVEIMLVVVIIGILATAAAMNIGKMGERARIKAATGELKTISSAIDLYMIENGNYPNSLEELKGDYVKQLSNDPWKNPYSYSKTGSGFSLKSNGPPGGKPITLDD